MWAIIMTYRTAVNRTLSNGVLKVTDLLSSCLSVLKCVLNPRLLSGVVCVLIVEMSVEVYRISTEREGQMHCASHMSYRTPYLHVL